MPKIIRKDQKIFAGSVAPTNVVAQYGSLAAGAKAYSSDLDLIQALPVWGQGWLNALINGSAPALQDRNAVDYVTTYQLAYLMEQGVPDYSATQNYFIGSYCKDETTGVMHVSKTNDNQNNALSDSTNWEPLSVEGRGSTPLGAVVAVLDDYSNVSVPSSGSIDARGFQICDGAALAAEATIGTGSTLGSNTPDLTDGRFLRGSNASGTTGGSATKTLAATNLPTHSHTMAHTHTINHNHPSGGGHTHNVRIQNTSGGSTIGPDVDSGINGFRNYFSESNSVDLPNFTGSSGGASTANTGQVGSGTAFNIEPAYLDVTYLIRVK